MEIVELGLVREHKQWGPCLGKAPGEADPLLPETGDEDEKRDWKRQRNQEGRSKKRTGRDWMPVPVKGLYFQQMG